MKPEILFISRNYPPQIGGLETYSYNLIRCFEEHHAVAKIVLGRSKEHLFWFLPYAFLKSLQEVIQLRIGRVHLCDGVLSPIGVFLRSVLRVRVSVTIHGLDITYGNSLYQSIIPRCTAQLDRIICVSKHTETECAQRGIPTSKCFVIPNGVNSAAFETFESRDECRSDLERRIGVALRGKTILLSLGRLVPRKGVIWFIQEVMPHLDHRYLYLVGGDGPDRERIASLIIQYKLEGRVYLVGRVDEQTRNRLYHASDVFLMPNVRVEGDVEGFGIAAIEAGCCGLPVIASDLQGLRDAVLDGRTGFFVEAGSKKGFLDRIRRMELDREEVRSLVLENFEWKKIYERYQIALLDNRHSKKWPA